ncbi:DUF4411 family protein [Aestuariibacter sp. GS-14]|uniref:DUF4411 family protein n=1 Tax=Aestuariibacter sp. GS-14 TaxID=2590670 RepID=UPI00112A98FD|nr:DUF4411 family protein [Aestuariibacter sp. GS-14]TPV56938.1 DUF4411 family protein [Aestuariibacter sp. GS-14]
MIYLLDSNTYIQAKNLYYQMEFCPAYWDWLDLEFAKGQVSCISSVYDELVEYKDELSTWVKQRKEVFLPVADDETQSKFGEVVEYVYGLENKDPVDVGNFLDKADPWIIAKASVLDATIVTHERLTPENSRKVKIPNIAKQFNVECVSTYALLKSLKARFILSTA